MEAIVLLGLSLLGVSSALLATDKTPCRSGLLLHNSGLCVTAYRADGQSITGREGALDLVFVRLTGQCRTADEWELNELGHLSNLKYGLTVHSLGIGSESIKKGTLIVLSKIQESHLHLLKFVYESGYQILHEQTNLCLGVADEDMDVAPTPVAKKLLLLNDKCWGLIHHEFKFIPLRDYDAEVEYMRDVRRRQKNKATKPGSSEASIIESNKSYSTTESSSSDSSTTSVADLPDPNASTYTNDTADVVLTDRDLEPKHMDDPTPQHPIPSVEFEVDMGHRSVTVEEEKRGDAAVMNASDEVQQATHQPRFQAVEETRDNALHEENSKENESSSQESMNMVDEMDTVDRSQDPEKYNEDFNLPKEISRPSPESMLLDREENMFDGKMDVEDKSFVGDNEEKEFSTSKEEPAISSERMFQNREEL